MHNRSIFNAVCTLRFVIGLIGPTVQLIAGQVTLYDYAVTEFLSHTTRDDWWFYYEKYSSAR